MIKTLLMISFLITNYSCSTTKQDKKIIKELDNISINALSILQSCFDNTKSERESMGVEFDIVCLSDNSLLARNIGLTDALPHDVQGKIHKCLNDKSELLKSSNSDAESCSEKGGDRTYQVRATIFPVKVKTIFNSKYKFISK